MMLTILNPASKYIFLTTFSSNPVSSLIYLIALSLHIFLIASTTLFVIPLWANSRLTQNLCRYAASYLGAFFQYSESLHWRIKAHMDCPSKTPIQKFSGCASAVISSSLVNHASGHTRNPLERPQSATSFIIKIASSTLLNKILILSTSIASSNPDLYSCVKNTISAREKQPAWNPYLHQQNL